MRRKNKPSSLFFLGPPWWPSRSLQASSRTEASSISRTPSCYLLLERIERATGMTFASKRTAAGAVFFWGGGGGVEGKRGRGRPSNVVVVAVSHLNRGGWPLNILPISHRSRQRRLRASCRSQH